jgi:hypothetical protein
MHIKAMVIFQGGTNVPEDRFVNTFHFDSTATTLQLGADLIHVPLTAWWNGPVGDNLGKAMPAFVSRTVDVRYYDMGQAEPRVPYQKAITLGTPIAAMALPEEVAVCATFHGVPPITPSRRGRVFLGPLSAYASDSGTATTPIRVIGAYRTLACNAMKQLADANVGWSVYSPKNLTLTEVTGGYCDNAFDTIRKRGMKTSARTTWVGA